jgi:hypothetical protein
LLVPDFSLACVKKYRLSFDPSIEFVSVAHPTLWVGEDEYVGSGAGGFDPTLSCAPESLLNLCSCGGITRFKVPIVHEPTIAFVKPDVVNTYLCKYPNFSLRWRHFTGI